MGKVSFKTKIYVNFLKKPIFRPIWPVFEKINLALFHWDMKEKTIRNHTENSNKYFVYRGGGQNDIAGLVGSYYLVMASVYARKKMGYTSFVDFETYKNQYSVERKINGSNNSWEYYFNQPEELKRQDIYKGNTVVLSGWRFSNNRRLGHYVNEFYNLEKEQRVAFMNSTCPIQKYILDMVDDKQRELFGKDKILGVFMRGTDYVVRKPLGHEIQPGVDEVVKKIEEFKKNYGVDRIFLVTEDADIFKKIKNIYGEHIFCSDYNYVNFNPKTDSWVKDSFHNDPYERGLNYLIRILLLSRCDYFIGGKASGSKMALDFGNYEHQYVFDLGKY